MAEFKVTVTSNLKQIYYVEAEDWEKAEEIVVLTEVDPDSEEFNRVNMETEETE
tara:strand:- start:1292 stop:1453 length:162 start_codon:yes stop_codon:yes gene_type:complete